MWYSDSLCMGYSREKWRGWFTSGEKKLNNFNVPVYFNVTHILKCILWARNCPRLWEEINMVWVVDYRAKKYKTGDHLGWECWGNWKNIPSRRRKGVIVENRMKQLHLWVITNGIIAYSQVEHRILGCLFMEETVKGARGKSGKILYHT